MRRKVHTPNFLRRLASFVQRHPNLEEKAREAVSRVVEGDPHLRIHTLHGLLKGFYATRITQSFRLVFALEPDAVIFIDIGSHDEVY